MKTTPTSRPRAHRPDSTPGNPPVARVSAPKNGGNFPSGGFCVTKRRRWIFSLLLKKGLSQEATENFTFPKFPENFQNVKNCRTSSRRPFSSMDRKFHVRQIFEKFPEREKNGHFFQPATFQQVTKKITFAVFSENPSNVKKTVTSCRRPISTSSETFHVSRIFRKFTEREIFNHFLLDPDFKKYGKKSRLANFWKIPGLCFFPLLPVPGHFREVAKLFTFPEFSRNSGFLKFSATSQQARFPTSTAIFHKLPAAPKNGALKAACGAGFGGVS